MKEVLQPTALASRLSRRAALLVFLSLFGSVVAMGLLPERARADDRVTATLEQLNARQREVFLNWYAARKRYEAALAAYWKRVEATRSQRRSKIRAGRTVTEADYVMSFPPEYDGPKLPPDILRIWNETQPESERKKIPTVQDVLESAKEVYGFVPERIPEREFKRRYAMEALAHGLTKEQIVRVYALETGGMGTHDMQSGINPVTRTGRPISTALGYAQLLHANSVSELVKHGPTFIARLEATADSPGIAPARARTLRAKANVLRKMLAAARKVPNEWSAHMRFAGTRNGLGIHALNLDGDIGPMLQVIKLKGVREIAEKAGRRNLTPAQLELMNLAGPSTGLEMMTPVGSKAPTPNFFSRGGYERNPVVHKRTAAELLAALDERMDVHEKKPGAVEFAAIFDELMARRQARR
jgi:hypothetical protein